MVHNQRGEEGKNNTQESTANPDHVLATLWNKVQEARPLRARHVPSVAEWGWGGNHRFPQEELPLPWQPKDARGALDCGSAPTSAGERAYCNCQLCHWEEQSLKQGSLFWALSKL